MKQADTKTIVEALRNLACDWDGMDGDAGRLLNEAAQRIETIDKLATDVVKASSRGDQHFIDCLNTEDYRATRLRCALARLGDQLREW